MRHALLALLLVTAAVAAGCTSPSGGKDNGLKSASLQDEGGSGDDPAGNGSGENPPPQGNSSGNGNSTGTPPGTGQNPPPGGQNPPPQPPAAPKPADYSDHQETWVPQPSGPTPYSTTLTVPVAAQAQNATVKVELVTLLPNVGRVPKEPGNLTVKILDGSGNLLGEGKRDAQSAEPFVIVQLPGPLAPGDRVVQITVSLAGSDGKGAGTKWVADVFVNY